jgi:hypothetical protein
MTKASLAFTGMEKDARSAPHKIYPFKFFEVYLLLLVLDSLERVTSFDSIARVRLRIVSLSNKSK